MKRTVWSNMSLWWLAFAGLVLATVLVWQAARWTYLNALNDLIATGGERLTLYDRSLRGALDQYAYLPYVLSLNADVRIMLQSAFNYEQVNDYLEALKEESGVEALYVMNAVGKTLASSNWREDLSFVGRNYGFRPYFTEAKAGRQGQQFAIGVTTGRPGFFMSQPVHHNQNFLGVAVAKVDLTPLQEGWREGGETVLVSDANGVLFLSSRDDWRYKTLTSLSQAQQTMIRAGRQYGEKGLELLTLETRDVLAEGQKIVRYDGIAYLMLSRRLSDFDWQLHQVVPLKPVRERAQAVAIIGTVLALLMLSLGLYARERRQKQISRRKALEAEAVQRMNVRLQSEIAERTRTETALRKAQTELVQTGKLAALGHMAAGIVHELNQPISAIRTQAASGRLLLERQKHEMVHDTLAAVTRMTDHMASITAQLKTFARDSATVRERVILQECLEEALTMTTALINERQIDLQRQLTTKPLIVSGDPGRIRQVLVNLLKNAADAMRGSAVRQLEVAITDEGENALISIADSGGGIADKDLDELFTPFFTTKEVGEGLGLGLSISYRIISDLGGTLRAVNRPGDGARFDVRLPLIESAAE